MKGMYRRALEGNAEASCPGDPMGHAEVLLDALLAGAYSARRCCHLRHPTSILTTNRASHCNDASRHMQQQAWNHGTKEFEWAPVMLKADDQLLFMCDCLMSVVSFGPQQHGCHQSCERSILAGRWWSATPHPDPVLLVRPIELQDAGWTYTCGDLKTSRC